MPDPAFDILVATMIASVILMIWHPIRLLAAIQGILTGLVVVGVFGVVPTMAARLMKTHEPVQQSWSREILGGALLCTLAIWILFTIFHAVAVVWWKLHPKADV